MTILKRASFSVGSGLVVAGLAYVLSPLLGARHVWPGVILGFVLNAVTVYVLIRKWGWFKDE